MRIFITGDFAPRFRVIDSIENKDYHSLFGDILPIMGSADFRITNLELPLVDCPTPIAKTGPNLIASTKCVETLKYAGFDMVTLANNHTMDQGAEGLKSTLQVLDDNNIKHVGAGMCLADAAAPEFIDLQGKRVAFVNFCENEWSTTNSESPGCNPLDEVSIFYQLIDVRRNADYLIVIVHGGHEMYGLPSPRMKKLYRWFVDLGADAVIGHHTHCYCGRECYKGKPIVYSLGNFVFDNPELRSGLWTNGCACMLTLENGSVAIEMFPFHQCDSQVGIRLYDKTETTQFNSFDEQKSAIISDDRKLKEEFSKHVEEVKSWYINMFEPSDGRCYQFALSKGLLPHLITKRHFRQFLNLIRCEAHRDILIESLKEKPL